MYIVVKITENIDLTLYIFSILNHEEPNSNLSIIRYFHKGMDRILISLLIFILLYSKKNIRHVLKKIFQPQNPNN